jgi:hypothetical protein
MRKYLLASFAVLAVIAAVVLAYRTGYRRAEGLEKGRSYVNSLDALKWLRKGKDPQAIGLLERVCFDNAYDLLSDTGYESRFAFAEIPRDVRAYRAAYRTNAKEWIRSERGLEEILKR